MVRSNPATIIASGSRNDVQVKANASEPIHKTLYIMIIWWLVSDCLLFHDYFAIPFIINMLVYVHALSVQGAELKMPKLRHRPMVSGICSR